MRTILTLVAVVGAVVVGLSGPAHAGSATGKVAAFHVDGAHVILSVGGPVASRSACNVGNGFAADANAVLGQAVGQAVAAVEGTEFKVTAVGAGTCTVTPGFEDLVSLQVSAAPSR
jgi:hypothetical protein